MRSVTVFAPATVANVAVGFDVLGFAFGEIGDLVTVEKIDAPGPGEEVVIESVRASALDVDHDLPTDPQANTAGRALLAMIQDLELPFGFRVRLQKGIPLGSGMGGSAASAVGAVVAANAILDRPVANERLIRYALEGEAVASGGVAHGDNVAPCLFGGLCCFLPVDPPEVLKLPVPSGLSCVLVRPRIRQDTKDQRALLTDVVPLGDYVAQTAHMAAFVAGCYRDDIELLRKSMRDLIIAPQRAPGVPGMVDACTAARAAGALGCSIAGSGPSVFAWVEDAEGCAAVQNAIVGTFAGYDVPSDAWVGPVSLDGASIVS